jgi:hypothetical protein
MACLVPIRGLALLAGAALGAPAFAQEAVFQTRSLTPETALVAARAATDACRKQGCQVAVALVSRAGLTQVLPRDRFAGACTTSFEGIGASGGPGGAADEADEGCAKAGCTPSPTRSSSRA